MLLYVLSEDVIVIYDYRVRLYLQSFNYVFFLFKMSMSPDPKDNSVKPKYTDKTKSVPANADDKRPFIFENHPKKALNNLNSLRKHERFCDVELVSGDVTVKAHKVVLAASCAYFEAMFGVGLTEARSTKITLPTIPPYILELLVDFMYSGEVMICRTTVQDLMVAADMLQLRELVTGCGEYLRKELHPTNVLGIYRFAEAHNCVELASSALHLACDHWPQVAVGDEILDLPVHHLIKLISSEHLIIDSEDQVLKAALRWLQHDPELRRRHCFELLMHVRLSLVNSSVLESAISSTTDPSLRVALRNVYKDMVSGRGVLVPLHYEPRQASKRDVYLVGGATRDPGSPRGFQRGVDIILASCLKFDLQKWEWTEVAPMTITRIQPGVAALGGKLYVVGGEQGSQILANGEVYDPQTNTWSEIAPMNEARCEFGLTAWRGCLYALGGWVGADMGATIEVYDPTTNVWKMEGYMPEPRFGMGVISYDDAIYIIGGCTHATRYVRSCLEFRPDATSQQWRKLRQLKVARSQAGVAVLNSSLYVVGGNTSRQQPLDSCERYCFKQRDWIEVTSMTVARASPAVVALSGNRNGTTNNRLIVAGGDTFNDLDFFCTRHSLSAVEVYDELLNRWSQGPSLPASRAEAGAALV